MILKSLPWPNTAQFLESVNLELKSVKFGVDVYDLGRVWHIYLSALVRIILPDFFIPVSQLNP